MAEENASVGSGILGMFNAFVDPAGLAKAAKAKLFWLWPLILALIVFIVVGNLMLPYSTPVHGREDGRARHAARTTGERQKHGA